MQEHKAFTDVSLEMPPRDHLILLGYDRILHITKWMPSVAIEDAGCVRVVIEGYMVLSEGADGTV